MTETTLSQHIAAFAQAATFDSLPPEVVDSVRGRILDTLGICLAATALPTSHAAIDWVGHQGGIAEATAFGLEQKVPAAGAAFVNGVLAHSLDYDDTHLPSVLHPSASTIPAALAAAQANESSGEQTIAAIAVGIEVAVRLGMAGYDSEAGNSVFFEHGQHATSITGAMGASVAAGMLHGLDEAGLADVLGVTASMASGIIESNRTGGTVKRMHAGWAAHSAVSAAQLVQRGFTGPPTVLEGRFGFFEAWLHGNFSAEEITEGLGTTWSVPSIFFKPYPANHFTHAAIDAALALREKGLVPSDIDSVEVGAATAPARTIGEPIEVKRAPETGYMAQFSAPFVVAAALTGGGGLGLGLDDFTDDRATDPAMREIMAKVSVTADAECDEIFPHQFPAVLRVRTKDGRELVEKVLANRGGPDRPLSFEELAAKFEDNAARVCSEEQLADMRDTIVRFEHLAEVSPALKLGLEIHVPPL
ncbi:MULTISPECIES: MmgE/PrpD family protein [unclassified Brevibacterium]|uniref:MmgE/PrpD family protein n=1 Tax=unclassified Brevibacterium TaxID=2614124 RepID=UPI001E2861E7|nr:MULTISPECIES: MmgE/PrpD family protein [unclassified Brevibacterium]MCD1286409.1 2-methylcitrate dehydratase [Brevibacterium sp. CCUG 69071]MDK8433778.1 MmgE/PrpD family protein [Brevibacterium sp. H-BE7]